MIAFGVLKDWLGPSAVPVELEDDASVAEMLERLRAIMPERAPMQVLRAIAVSVNAEYARADHVLHDGDEVGLLPPVSGGAAPSA
ncbi:MAG: MoaD/ThiS family protein, partial [Terracidiphilus sp.]